MRAQASLTAAIGGALVFLQMAAAALGQQAPDERPSYLLTSMFGVDNFHAYCSPCHGRDGQGRGPVALVLKTAPPDLTTLASRNHGAFPRARVRQIVTSGGPEIPAHGSRDMPVWGPTFRALDASDRSADTRIANIVEYLASIQR